MVSLRNSIIKFILFYSLIFTVLAYYTVDFITFSPRLLILILSVVIVVIFLFVSYKQLYPSLGKEYFRPSILFIVGYLIVFFQRYIDVLIGNMEANNRYLFVSPELINKCALLSLIGLLCFIIGYLFYNPAIKKIRETAVQKYVSIRSVRWLNYLLLILVIWFLYAYGSYYLSNIYSKDFLDSHKGSAASYLQFAIQSLIFAILILHAKTGKKEGETFLGFAKSLGLLFHISFLAYFGLFLLTGDRGPLFTITLAYFFAYIIKVRPKINLIVYAILLGIASFSLSVIGIARKMDPVLTFYDRVSYTINENAVSERNSVLNSTAELSSSVRCLHYAIDYVPEKHPYFYGSFQFRELLAVIPFSNLVTKDIWDGPIRYRSSAYFITYINQGAAYTYGDGSNVVADLYLSFDVFGVIIGLFLFGIFIKKIEVILFTRDPSKISLWYYSLAMAYVSLSIYISRSTLLDPLREAIFSFLIVVIYNFIFEQITYNPKKTDKYPMTTITDSLCE